jgi:hypothetical protein
MENWCGPLVIVCDFARGCEYQRLKGVEDDLPDTAQPNDVFVKEQKRARNREYNRAYRERKKMKVLAGENVHVDPDVIERRRACVRERVKRYRERKKVMQAAAERNLWPFPLSLYVCRRVARHVLFHYSNLELFRIRGKGGSLRMAIHIKLVCDSYEVRLCIGFRLCNPS